MEGKRVRSILSLFLLSMVTGGMVMVREPSYQRGDLLLSLMWDSQGALVRAQLSLDLVLDSCWLYSENEVGRQPRCFHGPSFALRLTSSTVISEVKPHPS